MRLQQRLQRLLREFAELHQEWTNAPPGQRFGTSLLLAMRPCEPSAFEAVRQAPDQRQFSLEGAAAAPR